MIMITPNELEAVRAAIKEGGKLERLWRNMLERTERQIQGSGLVQDGDTVEWWHLAWERISDAAFVYAVDREHEAGRWLRNVVLELLAKPGTEWHGPWFRGRGNPQAGVLETSHVGVAMCTAYDLAGDLFDEEERAKLRDAIREHCQEPCKRSLDGMASSTGNISNWFMVLLNGYGTASIILDDRPAVEEALTFYETAVRMYNADSYGESLQYWNYATLHLSHLNEMLIRYDSKLAERADSMCYVRCMPWAAQSLLYMKPLGGAEDPVYPRSANFGDSAAIYRPSADILMHVACRAKNKAPTEAGLASWLFEQTYERLELERNELGTFAFVSSYQFMTMVHYLEAAAPLSPEEAGLPLTAAFETGNVIVRDGRTAESSVLAIQAGYVPLQVTSHNHHDQGSFILAHRNERFFIDPGHACYRLETQAKSIATESHNTWTFAIEGANEPLVQQSIEGANFRNPRDPLVRRKLVGSMDGITAVRSELAEAYGGPIRRAERTWITAFPHLLFVVDRIKADVPVKARVHFNVNNRDNKLLTNLYSDTKIVLRRGEAAVKFFLMDSFSDGAEASCKRHMSWGHMHQYYHPLPNQDGQGKEGSAVRFTYENQNFAKEQVMVYAFAMDGLDAIRGWHMYKNEAGHYYAEPPGHEGGLAVGLGQDGELLVTDERTGRTYRVGDTDIQLSNGG